MGQIESQGPNWREAAAPPAEGDMGGMGGDLAGGSALPAGAEPPPDFGAPADMPVDEPPTEPPPAPPPPA